MENTLSIHREDVSEFEVSTEAGSLGWIHLSSNEYHEWIQIDIGDESVVKVILTAEGKVDTITATDVYNVIHYLKK